MDSNFKIVTRQSNGNIYIDLIGEFNGFSAIELIDVLKANSKKTKNFIINTNGLFLIHPLALDVFRKEFPLNDASFQDLLFIGKHGNRMEPKTKESFWY
ncbi:hypothetical protein [Desulfobacterium sp. N47]|uniref:STAS domain-containing protein n=1 Tax=uncultured Desulfobacterium sp. TaxID=201089 RepID=E1YGC6_9BACT|nr:unknown protein [uncultured Desulfobacterium sp.]